MAYPKLKQYCGYSERCHSEVREKAFGMGLAAKEVEILLAQLIEEDYLNEERFAILFAGGHFRQKKWGKSKIVYALRQKRVSEQNIKRAIREIEATDYELVLEKLAGLKWKLLKGEQVYSRQAKTSAYLLQKGYELPLIQKAIKKIRQKNDV
ncbi:MAG: RecX family transcriptional regulator [Bacteroidota bacterium]|nr:RecX family transcriptional regulator [Bacteroidota bacterium]